MIAADFGDNPIFAKSALYAQKKVDEEKVYKVTLNKRRAVSRGPSPYSEAKSTPISSPLADPVQDF